MSVSRLATALAPLALAAAAQAHTHLERSSPADGSVLRTAPEAIELQLSQPARITTLTLQKGKGKGQPLGPLPKAPVAKLSVPAPDLTPGEYVVNWRALSRDNHVVSGAIRFTVSPGAGAGATGRQSQPAPPPEHANH